MVAMHSGKNLWPGAMRHRQVTPCRHFGTSSAPALSGPRIPETASRQPVAGHRLEPAGYGIVCALFTGMYPDTNFDHLLNELVARAREAMIVIDSSGAIRFENDASRRLTGRSADHRAGRPFLELIHPDDRDRVRAALERATDVREPAALVECRAYHIDGREISLEILISLAPAAEHSAHVLMHVRDVSERLEMTARLRHAHKLASLGHLTMGVGEDLARVIATIRSQLDHLPTSEAPPFF